MKFLLSIIVLFHITTIYSQPLINTKWVVGQSSYDYKQILVDFNPNQPNVTLNTTNIKFGCKGICPVMEDSVGQIQFYTNGRLVVNREGDLMENGDSFPPYLSLQSGWPAYNGHSYKNNSFVLPDFYNPHIYYFFYIDWTNGVDGTGFDLHRTSLYYLKIDMTQNGGLGKVVEKNVPVLLRDSATGYSIFTPVRHANGRDWWILTNELGTNIYHRILWTPDGINKDFPTFTIQGPIENPPDGDLNGQEISPDGTKYAVRSSHSIWVYDFDRCTGLLSNPVKLAEEYQHNHWIIDMALSDNNRYVYATDAYSPNQYTSLLRFDLWDSNPAATVDTLIGEGANIDYVGGLFHLPTGQIGYGKGNGRVIHTFPYPGQEEFVIDTAFIEWGYKPSLFGLERTNPVNYYVGPIDGSTCDTLGLDNEPLAHWRYDLRPNALEIKFVDLTYYEPTYWHWDFGEGQTSDEQHPLHVFAQAGVYETCLIVGNQNAADTLCKMVVVGDMLSANIVVDTLVGCAPLQVHFHADTTAADSIKWYFHDGIPATSNELDVTVTYEIANYYPVQLSAFNDYGEKIATTLVDVRRLPIAKFQFGIDDDWQLTVYNSSNSGATQFLWDYGDGTTDTLPSPPKHTYTAPGNYTLSLIATGECGSDTLSHNIIITGTDDLKQGLSFSLYPNPNDGQFNIDFQANHPDLVELQIFDILGRSVWQEQWSNRQSLQTTIDLNTHRIMPTGTYFYALRYGGTVVHGKMVIE